MAGRKLLDRDRISKDVLKTAEGIIALRGLGALNAREVAQGAGIAVGTLYNIYGSLDLLIQQVNARTLDRLCARLETEAARAEGPEERMAAMARAYIDFADEQPLVWRAVFDHQPAGESARADWYSASIERIAALAIAILNPIFPGDQRRAARRAATIIWSGVHGICALAQGGNLRHVTHADPRRLAEDLARGYLAGLDREDPAAPFKR
ncbi:MAG: TetR/AcrR family transcriptional regulator [Rhizobiales bacterium]|nr:TetR/AcrR family transcriptional regulator [Hyphomicrobiales bacterium]